MPHATVDPGNARRRAVTELVATELVADVANVLAELDIPVMPVKGALLQHWLAPRARHSSDVDVLVPPERFRRAIAQLEAHGYRRAAGSSIGAVVMQTPLAIALDLHPRLFDRARYRFPTHALFARGIDDDTLYGTRVRLPSRLDVYAHLVGKAGSDHLSEHAQARLEEIAAMGAQLDASPKAAAEHLVQCGMGRVTRYVLPLVDRRVGDRVAREVLAHLPGDRMGDAIASFAGIALPRCAPTSTAGATVAHLMNDTLPRACLSGARAVFGRRRRRS